MPYINLVFISKQSKYTVFSYEHVETQCILRNRTDKYARTVKPSSYLIRKYCSEMERKIEGTEQNTFGSEKNSIRFLWV